MTTALANALAFAGRGYGVIPVSRRSSIVAATSVAVAATSAVDLAQSRQSILT